MRVVRETNGEEQVRPVRVALCAGREIFDRFGTVLRHLVVGLVDSAISVRVVSDDPRVESLALGPIQAIRHGSDNLLTRRRRVAELRAALSPQPPTTVHALSGGSYRLAASLADALEADLVLQATSLADCEAVTRIPTARVGHVIALSEPLIEALRDQIRVPGDRIELIRPGVSAAQQVACFSGDDRRPTIVCSSPLERGYGVERLIEATDILRRRNREVVVFLVGSGRRELALRRLTRDRKLSPNVIIACPAGETAQTFRGADVFVRPSADTAFSADTLQAMGAGIVTVTFANAVFDYFRDGENSVVCSKMSAACLADALEQLIVHPDEARRIAGGGIEYIRSHHAMSAMAERHAETYRKLLLARSTFPIRET